MSIVMEKPKAEFAISHIHNRPIRSSKELELWINRVTQCPDLKEILDEIECLINTDIIILLLGSTGVGKGIVARYLHAIGFNASFPFISVNCAGLPKERENAELFGWVKGAFPDAYRSNPGYLRKLP